MDFNSLNEVNLIGYVGQVYEVRYTPKGIMVEGFSLATSKRRVNKETGEEITETEWHNITAFGKIAEIVKKHVKPGAFLFVRGSLTTSKWQKDDETRYRTNIIVDRFTFLGGKGNGKKE